MCVDFVHRAKVDDDVDASEFCTTPLDADILNIGTFMYFNCDSVDA